jgi:transcriptional regulator with XRE-family HTH domain
VNGTPPVRRRLVGMTLRRYRESRGFTLEDAARVLECDRSKVSRIETGQRGIRVRDLRDLVAEYDVGEQERAFLAAIAAPKGASGWWREYEDVLAGEWRDYLIMESFATQVLTYRTQQIPGLLQTEAYAVAVAGAGASALDPGVLPRAAEATLARQKAVLGAEVELNVIIAEGALHQQVGGADVMRGQLARLAELAGSSPQLTIQVLPFTSGAYPDFGVGGLDILTFAGTSDQGLVRIPGISRGIYLEDAEDVTRYAYAFARIRDAALSAPASAAMIRRIADTQASTGEEPCRTAELLLCPGCCTLDHILAYECDPDAIAPQAGCARCSFIFPLLPAEFALVTLESLHQHDCCPSRTKSCP